MTEIPFLIGVTSALVFVAVSLIEGARRPGYNPTYHTVSELSLGDRGWVQRANFLQMGGGMFAFAVGVNRALDTPVGAVLVAIFGLGMVAAGLFLPDPLRGYPPGSPTGTQDRVSWHHRAHDVISGPIAFFAIFGACLVLASRLDGPWHLYTMLTAVVGLVLTISTALSYQWNIAKTGLVQRALILVYWSWIVLLGFHLGLSA